MSGERPKDGLEDILRNPGEDRELSRSRVALRVAKVKRLEAQFIGDEPVEGEVVDDKKEEKN